MAIDRDFALYPKTQTSIAVLGSGRIDGYFSEEHRVGLRKTKYPVESGATLTDNAVSIPERLRLEGLVSDLLPAPGNTLSPDRAPDTWAAIVSLAKARTTFDVVTALKVYENMLVVRAEAPRNNTTGNSLRFTLDLEELLLGQTEILKVDEEDVTPLASERISAIDGGDRTSTFVPVATQNRDFVRDTVDTVNRQSGTSQNQFSLLQPVDPDQTLTLPEIAGEGQQVPFLSRVRETFRTNIGGRSVRFNKFFQPLDQSWYMSLSVADIARTPIVTGVRLLGRSVPLAGVAADVFRGQLFVDGVGDPGRDAWGSTHRLLYMSEDLLRG